MPDKPTYTKRIHPAHLPCAAPTMSPVGHHTRRYAELRCKSNFSFLRGASHPEELAQQAADLGYAALAITDRNTLAGVVRMHGAAKACHLKLIVGAEIIPVDAPPILLYATDRASYGRLCRIITQGRLREVKGSCAVTLDDIAQWSKGLIAAMTDRGVGIRGISRPYRDIFRDRLYLAVSVHGGPDDDRHLAKMDLLARNAGIPMVATNDVHYHQGDRRFLQDVLTCIRKRCTLTDAGRLLFANAERHLKPVEEMERLFAGYPQALARTLEIADRCRFSLDELRYEYPESICPPGRDPTDTLAELAWAGARRRYPGGLPDKVRGLIEHELKLIRELEYEPYFLTVWDIVKFARSRDILCQGRGSAANSAVCYCLGITSVDPDRIELLFERFVSAERNEPPDIDVDFEHERREEVFQYIYNKYGREHAGIVAEVITYRPRSAIRDVGKVLGLSLDRVAILAKKHEWWDKQTLPDDFLRETGFDPSDRTVRMLGRLIKQLIGFPRHLSQHVGGFVITRGPLCEMVPIENAAMEARTFIEWDKDDIDALGILKIDCLSLGMLTAIRKCFDLVEEEWRMKNGEGRMKNSEGRKDYDCMVVPRFDSSFAIRHSSFAIPSLALHTIPEGDTAVYDMICRADTVGVFQIESRAQMSMLPRLKPRSFYDLVIEVAIVRPGPIQGGMVHPYLRRRAGEESITYPSEAIKEVLERTLGVPLFQEQAMRLAIVAAGFTPGEADQLRRAMGAWRKSGDITRFRTKLVSGMKANGLSEEFAERCFQQICGFGEYGFPESHAASFALLVYVSAWLKRYYPAAFCAAILNSQPMGFYRPAQLVRDAREHGVKVLGIDVNVSGYDCRLEGSYQPSAFSHQLSAIGNRQSSILNRKSSISNRQSSTGNPAHWGVGGPAVRLGMRLIKGVSRAAVEGIEREQRRKTFTSVAELARRSGVSSATLARLAAADAMQSLGLNRREAVWKVLALDDDRSMFEGSEPVEPPAKLPEMILDEVVYADYETMGLSLNAHPISLVRKELKGRR
ncbi:MAG: error-prone DNA polymerase, partial [Planctomycetes bacterium]|nr:error-prone DNA polymerase [Planctomycetota bacterium]